MGCTSSKSSNMIVLDPRQLKRSPSGHHLQFELPTSPSAVHGGPIIEELSNEETGGCKAHQQLDDSTAVTSSSSQDGGSANGQILLSIPDDDFMDCISVDTGNDTKVGPLVHQKLAELDGVSRVMFDAARRAQAEIQHYLTAEGESEFVSVGKAGPVELMARPPPVGEKFQVMMGRRSFGRHEIDLNSLLDTLMDPTALSKYNPHASDGRILRKGLIDEPERRLDLQYATFKGMFTVAARDAVYAILRERIHDNLWIVSRRSVDIPDCPYQDPQPGLVRCEFLCYGYAIMRDPQTGELSVTMFSQADPGGNVRNIPTWIANKGQRAQPASLNHLYNLLKADQRVTP